jgi:hypothetical protein
MKPQIVWPQKTLTTKNIINLLEDFVISPFLPIILVKAVNHGCDNHAPTDGPQSGEETHRDLLDDSNQRDSHQESGNVVRSFHMNLTRLLP